MSREILFKAKRIDNREWVKGCLIIDYVTGQYFIHQYGDSVNESQKNGEEGCLRFVAFEIDSDTLCQYTGGLDHYHNKIWENDICKVNTQNVDEEDGYFVVEWDAEILSFVLSGNGLVIDFDNLGTGQVEVVGNIFDNPDLLEV